MKSIFTHTFTHTLSHTHLYTLIHTYTHYEDILSYKFNQGNKGFLLRSNIITL